ncbi:hypothetical protein [Streptomyces sp. NPDC050485]|uniref:hypothetical protein n=1 Tax=Streptomyces sp. NPDC050485 TaxID=3365617 RepID=UPI0037B53D63
MKKLIAIGAVATALFGSVAAGTASASVPSMSPAVSCTTWHDAAGPGRAGRFHANCAGKNVYVQSTIRCSDGSTQTSAWRWEYAKAECPYGKAYRSGSYRTKA